VQLPVMRGLCAAKGYRLPELASHLELLGDGYDSVLKAHNKRELNKIGLSDF
jgi:hypothetical protein